MFSGALIDGASVIRPWVWPAGFMQPVLSIEAAEGITVNEGAPPFIHV